MNKILNNIINSFKYQPENKYIFDLPSEDTQNNQKLFGTKSVGHKALCIT